MIASSQLSDVLHVLVHLAESDTPVTSEALAKAMDTNPVVLRRLMGGLRDAGLVASGKGHGGGWTLAARLEDVSLRDVHLALGAPPLVSLGFREDRPTCLVAQVVNASLQASVQQAEAALLDQLGAMSLADLAAGVRQRMPATRGRGAEPLHRLEGHHAHR